MGSPLSVLWLTLSVKFGTYDWVEHLSIDPTQRGRHLSSSPRLNTASQPRLQGNHSLSIRGGESTTPSEISYGTLYPNPFDRFQRRKYPHQNPRDLL